MKKRDLAALMAAMLLLVACAGETTEENEAVLPTEPSIEQPVSAEAAAEVPLVLACGRELGEVHPAKLQDVSSSLVPLLYESLVSVDNSYRWSGELAEEITQNGLNYTVVLREAVFSDGSTVRAADVVNSMEAAMEEGSLWQNELSIVEDCVVLTANMIRITVTELRPDFENLLTFPVVKVQNNGNYLGSGQYVLNREDSDRPFLEQNPNFHGAVSGPETIALNRQPNSDTLYDSLRIGRISCLFDDLSSGEAMNLSENSQIAEIGHLVFLGANGQKGIMADAGVRRAVSVSIDRQLLVDRVYASKAVATETPFHPNYYRMEGYSLPTLSMDGARQLLEAAGLAKNQEGYYSNEEQSSLRLLYNSENAYRFQAAELIQQQLGALGLLAELVPLNYEDYMAALKDGDFDLYLGELAIDASMDVRRLFQQGEGYGYGSVSSTLDNIYASYQQGNAKAELVAGVYWQQMPAIPLLYRQGTVIYHEQVAETMESLPGQPFATVLSGQ